MEKSEKIWMDGKLVPWHEANVHVLTHTLHYGLGVFEGIRCYNSKENGSAIFRLQEHVDRLFQSAVILGIEVPFSNKEIYDAIVQVVRDKISYRNATSVPSYFSGIIKWDSTQKALMFVVPLRHGRGELILERMDSIKESVYAFLLSLDIT